MSQKNVMHFGANVYFCNGLFYTEAPQSVIPAAAILVGAIRVTHSQATANSSSQGQTGPNPVGGVQAMSSTNEEVIGAQFKSAIAQFVALELSRNSNVSDLEALSQLNYGLLANIDDTHYTTLQPTPSLMTQPVSSSTSPTSLIQSGQMSQPTIVNDPTSVTSLGGERNKNPQSLSSPGNMTMPSTPGISTTTQSPNYQSIFRHDCPLLHHLPWLKSTQQISSQQGPREFLVAVERARTLTWILIGANVHLGLTQDTTGINCRPVPLCLVRIIADVVKNILLGYPDQQKVSLNCRALMLLQHQSVVIMSALSQVFNLCLQWTVYCEAVASVSSDKTTYQVALTTAFEFWLRIMPTLYGILENSEDVSSDPASLHWQLLILSNHLWHRSEILSKTDFCVQFSSRVVLILRIVIPQKSTFPPRSIEGLQ
ncbi:Protein unc-79 [Cichlidogyrus casuarinus]|uniref:Protein unc-79 n=1 Tax=Cichlidogyrus casuarinus TaxID=1844966 RepID=A0ABD2PWA8_9PLAT